ncbi:remorin-like [Henckelia pumila]|uniref:remorin-like n=1 Tax=Henckelia pumila TaxID=405737 RepID=UPI003C6EA06D
MAEEESNKVVEGTKDVPPEEKSVIPQPPAEEKAEDCAAPPAVVDKPEIGEDQKKPESSTDRDAMLERVATEKRLCFIKAWEENAKSKAENKAQKKLSAVGTWENTKQASLEAELKKIEEQLEKKKSEYIEKTKNKVALVHKEAQERRAIIEAKRGEELLKAEETSAKCRASGTVPKKLLGLF